MTANISTAISRELGEELRRTRENRTTHTARSLATALGWDASKISNIETGKVRASELDLFQCLSVCGLNREQIEEFHARYRDAFDPYQVRLPENLRALALAEATTVKITCYDLMTVPGLLQTEPYARALIEEGGLHPEDQVLRFVRNRMDRQAILHRVDRPACTFYLHENVLRRQIGSGRVMVDQLTRLMFHTHVLRVVRESGFTAPYKLLEYEKDRPTAYLDSDLIQVFAQEPRTIARCKLIFEHLDEVSLDETRSRALLMEYVDVYGRQGS